MKLETNKKILFKIFIITIITVWFFGIVGMNAINAQSKEFIPLAGIPGVIDAEAAKDPSKFFNGMFTFGISIAGFLAVLMIAVGGIQYMSTDAVSGKTEGKDRITYAIMGLLLVLFSWVLLNQINPNILNLDIFSDISGGSSGGSNAKTTGGGSNIPTIGLPTATDDKIKVLEDLIKTGSISESDKELARQKILELKNQ